MNKTAIGITLVIVVGALVAYLYHINNNRYSTVSADGVAYLIDTKTGQSWAMRGNRKIPHNEIGPANKIEKLSESETMKLEGSASLSDTGYFSAEIYNGSNYDITELRVRLIINDRDGSESINRIYTVTPRYGSSAAQYKSSEFNAGFGVTLNSRDWTWTIMEVFGNKSE